MFQSERKSEDSGSERNSDLNSERKEEYENIDDAYDVETGFIVVNWRKGELFDNSNTDENVSS